MVEYYKQARRWQREAASKPPSELTFARDKSSGEFKLPPKRPSGVPPTGNPGIGSNPPARSPTEFSKRWKDYDYGGKAPLKWRGMGGGMLNFIGHIAEDAAKWDKGDWDEFMENGTLPEGLDFLNPSPDAYRRFAEKNGIPVVVPGTAEYPDLMRPGTDGFDYHFFVPTGLVNCNYSPGWAPGTGQNDARFTKRQVTDVGYQNNAPNCGSYAYSRTINPGYSPDMAPYFQRYTAIYVARFRISTGLIDGDKLPWQAWSVPSGVATPDKPVEWLRVPTGAPAPTIGSPPKSYHIPMGQWSGYAAPDFNASVPMRHAPYLKAALQLLGERHESENMPSDKQAWETEPTTQTEVIVGSSRPPPRWPPPVITKPIEPYKPPGSKTDRKTFVRGRSLFQAVQRGFHALTEYGDFIDSFYDALPKKRQTCKVGGPACKSYQVGKYFGEVDIVEAVVNWLWNDFEDRVLGRGFRSLDNAGKRLGTRDWKLMNGANDSPLDEGLGELYGEFVGDHVNPRKEDFVKWIKKEFDLQ